VEGSIVIEKDACCTEAPVAQLACKAVAFAALLSQLAMLARAGPSAVNADVTLPAMTADASPPAFLAEAVGSAMSTDTCPTAFFAAVSLYAVRA
jgi:hypothetical protein